MGFSTNAATIQGAGPGADDGYPVGTAPATGFTWPVNVVSGGGGGIPPAATSGTIAALNGAVTLALAGNTAVGVRMTMDATWNGDLYWQVSPDGGVNWGAIDAHCITFPGLRHFWSAGNRTELFEATAPGMTHFRVIALNYGAGSASIAISGTTGDIVRYNATNKASGVLPTDPNVIGIVASDPNSPSGWTIIEYRSGVRDGDTYNSRFLVEATGKLYNGASLDVARTPYVFKTVQAAALGSTALWTPTVGTKFRLMRYRVDVTGNAASAGGAVVTVALLDAAAAIGLAHDIWCPAAALAATGLYTSGWIDLGNGYPSALVNNILNVNLSAALTAGNVRVIACGTEE